MEDWKVALKDFVFDYYKGQKGKDRYVVVETFGDDYSEIVAQAIAEAQKTGYPLSTDFKKQTYVGDKVWVYVGSSQAQDEFVDRLHKVRTEVDVWRQNGGDNEIEKENIETITPATRPIDIETIVVAICLTGVLLLILTD